MTDTHHPDTPRNRGDNDAPHMSPVTPAEDARTIMLNKISWGAVLAGVVVALVTQLILNMLGIGIGAATLDPAAGAAENPSAPTFSIGAGIWFALSGIIASLAGGYAAGRLAGKPKESTAGWHGLTAWALTTLVIFYLLTSTVGGFLGGAYRTVPSALGNVAQTVGATAQTAAQVAAPNLAGVTDPFSSIEQSMRGATGGNDPAALRDAAVTAVRAAVTGNQQQAAGSAGARRPGHRPGPEHPSRAGSHASPAVRAAVPPDGGPGQAAGDAGGRHGRERRLARRAVRGARSSARRGRGLVRRAHGRGGADHHGAHGVSGHQQRPAPARGSRSTTVVSSGGTGAPPPTPRAFLSSSFTSKRKDPFPWPSKPS